MENNELNKDMNFFVQDKENIYLNHEFTKEVNDHDFINVLSNYDNNLFAQELNKRNVDFRSISNTLPGLIIHHMMTINTPLDENQLNDLISPNFNNLRKPNGSKYKNNLKKALKSTLSSTGIFKKQDDKYIINENEGLEYIERIISKNNKYEKEKDKEKEKDSKDNQDMTKFLKKKRHVHKTSNSNSENTKFTKVFNILDELLLKVKQSDDSKILKNPFKNLNSSIDLVNRVNDNQKCIGILLCFKFFKNIIHKYIALSSKKKKINSKMMNMNNLDSKLNTMRDKINMLEDKMERE